MSIPYQRAVMVLLPQNISAFVSSKVVRPTIKCSRLSNDGRYEGKMLRKVASLSAQGREWRRGRDVIA